MKVHADLQLQISSHTWRSYAFGYRSGLGNSFGECRCGRLSMRLRVLALRMRCSRWETNVAVVTLARPTLRGVRKNPRCEAPPLLFPRLRSPRRSRACLHIPAPSARCRSVCSLSPRCCLFHIAAGWRATCARPGSTDHPCLLFDQRGEINRVGQTGLPQRSRVPIRERPLHGSGSSGEMQLRDSAWLFRPRACRER